MDVNKTALVYVVLNMLVIQSMTNIKQLILREIVFSKITIYHFSTTFKIPKKGLAHLVTAVRLPLKG